MPEPQDIQAQTPDGVIHSFPAGTPDDVIDRTVKLHLGLTTGQGMMQNAQQQAIQGINQRARALPSEPGLWTAGENPHEKAPITPGSQNKLPWLSLSGPTPDVPQGMEQSAHIAQSLPAVAGAASLFTRPGESIFKTVAGGALGSAGGRLAAKGGGKLFGLSPENQELAEKTGSVAGGLAGGALPWMPGTARSIVLDPVTGKPTTSIGSMLERVLRTPEEEQAIMATKKGPNVPITQSPNYPALAAARGQAMKSARQELATQQNALVSGEGGTTGSAQKPFEPLVYESPEEASQIDFRNANLKRQASAAGTYHAAQGAAGKKTNLQQRIAKKSLPWEP